MRRQSGQITVFIALLFQVLFVFFAMLINVGMTVHDKINLQNSIDMSVYYGAKKQAEILNAIAHINYQIHQDWKLLAWRLRALGDSARTGHPGITTTSRFSIGQPDTLWGESNRATICMTSKTNWSYNSSSGGENICGPGQNVKIPEITDLDIPAFFPWDFAVKDLIKDIKQQVATTCTGMGEFNFSVALAFMSAYRYQVGIRQNMIEKLADNLQNFTDLEGNSIEEGMLKTVRANLTRANLESLRETPDNFKIFNSMQDLTINDWLPNTKIWPLIYYTDLFGTLKTSCTGKAKLLQEKPNNMSGNQNAFIQKYGGIIYEPKGQNEAYHSTRGREKNPWLMVYTGAKISTKPRKPFFPFGDPVELKARGFAKPFGGRVGPWTKQYWTRQKGWAQTGEDVDTLKPARFEDPKTYQMSQANIPNFSRFPGDTIGLKSGPTLSIMKTDLVAAGRDVNLYAHLPEQAATNPLAWREGQQNIPLRNFELAAVAPNLFDITYYSIQPEFHAVYGEKLAKIVNTPEEIPMDLGSMPDEPFSVKQQIATITEANDFKGFKAAFFKISDWMHVLTNWAPNATMDYSFPAQRFGNCQLEATSQVTDSSCVAGGRSGYSVKIVSRAYLNSPEHAVGGNPSEKAPLLNAPGDF